MSGSLVPYQCGEAVSVERIRCPNPKCGRHILDIEEMPPGRTVLEMKCRRCGHTYSIHGNLWKITTVRTPARNRSADHG